MRHFENREREDKKYKMDRSAFLLQNLDRAPCFASTIQREIQNIPISKWFTLKGRL
jgi:hypothetical protein